MSSGSFQGLTLHARFDLTPSLAWVSGVTLGRSSSFTIADGWRIDGPATGRSLRMGLYQRF